MAASPPRSPPRRQSIIIERTKVTAPTDTTRFLIHAACTDTYHDFHKKAGFSDKMVPGIPNPGVFDSRLGLFVPDNYKSIPKSRDGREINIDALHDEDELLVETFRHVILDGSSIVNQLNITQALITYLRRAPGNVLNDQNFDGFWSSQTATEPAKQLTNNYNIKLFSAGGETDIKQLWTVPDPNFRKTPSSKATQGDIRNFFGGDEIYLVFDASVLDLMSFIKSTTAGGAGQQYIHRMFNREVVNDPATKTYEDRPFAGKDHIASDVCFDNDAKVIIYPRNVLPTPTGAILNKSPFQRDKLFSKYDFSLGELVYQKSGAPRINLELQDPDGNRIHCSADPHEDNNIAKCWKRVMESYKKESKHINSAAHFHCKRSGDWLQALSCLDTARAYNNTPIGTPGGLVPANFVSVAGKNLILVTHDRVLLAYALTLGIDVIMTYKWSEAGVAAAAGGPGAAEEANSDADEAGADDNNSTRFIIYFRNSKNDTPEQKRAVLVQQIKSADTLYHMDNIRNAAYPAAQRKNYIDNYNSWVDQIRASAQGAIDTAYAAAAAAADFKSLGKAITVLLKAYIRYSSIDYSKLDKADYVKIENLYKTRRDTLGGRIDGAWVDPATFTREAYGPPCRIDDPRIDLTNLADFAGAYNVQVSNIANRKLRITNLADLVAANNAFNNNTIYSSPIILTGIVLVPRRAGESGPNTQILETVSFLTQRLEPDMYADAIVKFTAIRDTHAAKFVSAKPFVYDLFLPNLITAAPTAATEIAAATKIPDSISIDHVAASNVAAVEEEVIVDREIEAAAAAAPIDTTDPDTNDPAAVLAASVDDEATTMGADVDNEGEAVQDEPIERDVPSATRKRKVAGLFASIGATIKRFGQSLFGRVIGPARGGGSQSRNFGVTAEYLVKLYLRELYFSLSAFETEGNFDYDYYKTLAAIGVVASKLNVGNWTGQQAFFYDELPKMEFNDIYPAEKQTYLRHNIGLAASTLALNSIDLAVGPIPSLGFAGLGPIPLQETMVYIKELRKMKFDVQRDTLIAALKDAILERGPAAALLAAAPLSVGARANRNRATRKAAAANRMAIGHVLGTGETVRNNWLVKAAANRAAAATAAAAAQPAPGPYVMTAPIRARGGDKRRSRKSRRTHKSRSTRKLNRRRGPVNSL